MSDPGAQDLLCIDFEASTLGPGSFPIEVALAEVATGAVRSWLIRPAMIWLARGHWSEDAERLHGIDLARLEAEGEEPGAVAAAVLAFAAGRPVFSDAPAYDQQWLDALCGHGRAGPVPRLLHLAERAQAIAFHRRGVLPGLTLAGAAAEAARRVPEVHRAAPDARRNAELLRILLGLG